MDEATQCCEAETLIPLMLGVKNLILVGDPNQLPATVMSTVSIYSVDEINFELIQILPLNFL